MICPFLSLTEIALELEHLNWYISWPCSSDEADKKAIECSDMCWDLRWIYEQRAGKTTIDVGLVRGLLDEAKKLESIFHGRIKGPASSAYNAKVQAKGI